MYIPYFTLWIILIPLHIFGAGNCSGRKLMNLIKEGGKKGRKTIRKKNQQLRNHGEAYKTYRGKGRQIDKKTEGPYCNCRNKCFVILSDLDRKRIFKNFWSMENHNVQNSYLFGCLSSSKVKRKTKKDLPSRRNFTIQYSVISSGEQNKICKNAFLSIHGLQNNRGRIENIASNIVVIHQL